MGTQYEIWNADKNEYITGQSLQWDSKRRINVTGRLSGILYILIETTWSGDRIHIISIENLDENERQNFYIHNKDITQEAYDKAKSIFPEDF